uniref:Glutaredoxin domain-containing protein n=1 Tax=Panagrolaimus superbus TaxID=310955 RepID=A0A914YJF6_9BILA
MKYIFVSLLIICVLFFAVKAIKKSPHPDDLEKEIDDLIHNHRLMVFSKTYCPYSKRAKKLLHETLKAKEMEVLEINEREDMSKIQDHLLSISGVRTVPQVFLDGKFIGGATDLEKMQKKGNLRPMLVKANLL